MIILTNCERGVLHMLATMHAELGEPPTIVALARRLGHKRYTTCQKILRAARQAGLVERGERLRASYTPSEHGKVRFGRLVLTPKGVAALEYRPPLLAPHLGPIPAESTRRGGWPARRAKEAHRGGIATVSNLLRTRGAYG